MRNLPIPINLADYLEIARSMDKLSSKNIKLPDFPGFWASMPEDVKTVLPLYLIWFILPLIIKFIPALFSIVVLRKRRKRTESAKLKYYPHVTVIAPVFKSYDALYKCIRSIDKSNYPKKNIQVLLLDSNQDSDHSPRDPKPQDSKFNLYARAQKDFPDLYMQWLNTEPGRSNALNAALYNSRGEYVINIGADGYLDNNAILYMVEKFESDIELSCMTGAVLTSPTIIEKQYKKYFPRLLRRLEFMEYAQDFIASRAYKAENGDIYTIAGAFTAFRRSSILSSRLYNSETISQDTQMTFQMKYLYKHKVDICENAIFYTSPVENIKTLYEQRQNGVRGEIEVSKMFKEKIKLRNIFTDINVSTIIYDHTLSFPRIMWFFAVLYMIFTGNMAAKYLLASLLLIYAAYVLIGCFYYSNIKYYIRQSEPVYEFYKGNKRLLFFLPLYHIMIFFFKFAGIINTATRVPVKNIGNKTQGGETDDKE